VQRVLEAGLLEHGPSEDLQPQLSLVKAEQGKAEQKAQRDAAREEAHELLETALFPTMIDRLEPLASANDDAGLTKLLEKTRRKQDEGEGEVGLTAQFTEVLLKAQPGEAPSSPQKKSHEVRAKENKASPAAQPRRAADIRTAVENAVAACDTAIARGELDHCMRPLEDLAKQYGEDPALATAREACESKRGNRATQVLREALQAAERQLGNSSAKKAERALKGVEYALPFADADLRSEWQWLKAECAAALNAKQPISKGSAPAKRDNARWYVAGSVVAVAALAVVGLSPGRHEAPAPQTTVAVRAPAPASTVASPAIVPTDVEINASPWAKVVSFQDKTGKSIALPDGDQTTPLRLDGVNSGTYEVTFAGADGKQQTVECNVSAAEHLCAADMGTPDTERVLMGKQP
jgi:serine/threonine-protein kinase